MSLPTEDTEALVDASAGRAVQWISGKGWIEANNRTRGKK